MEFFAQLADGFDRMVDENDLFFESVGEQLAQNYLDNADAENTVTLGSWGVVHGAHKFR